MAFKLKSGNGPLKFRNMGSSPAKHAGEDSFSHHANITGDSDHWAWQDKTDDKVEEKEEKQEDKSWISKAKDKMKGHITDVTSTVSDLSEGKDYDETAMSKWKDKLWKHTINK